MPNVTVPLITRKLLVPGPVTIRPEVQASLAKPLLFHRSLEFKELFNKVHLLARTAMNIGKSHELLILPGTGTQALEATLASLMLPGRTALVIHNGYFADRISQMLLLLGLPHGVLRGAWGDDIDFDLLRAEVIRLRPSYVVCVALETSTGVAYDIHSVARVCAEAGCELIVDAVSAMFAEALDINGDQIAACVTVANKALEAPPGLAFVAVRRDILASLTQDGTPLTHSLKRAYEASLQNQTLFTVSSSPFYATLTSLELYAEEGSDRRRQRYKGLSQRVRTLGDQLEWRRVVPEHSRASAISAFSMARHDALRVCSIAYEAGYVVWYKEYPEYGPPGKGILEISVMGDVSPEDISALGDCLGR